jgi:hypothetical protein
VQRLTLRISSFITTLSRTLRNSQLEILTAFLVAFSVNQLPGYKPLYGAELFCPSGNVTCLYPHQSTTERLGGLTVYQLFGAQ